jgi:hypothetical protein
VIIWYFDGMQVMLTGDVNLAVKARASGIPCRKLAGSAGTTIENLPTSRPQLLKEFFPEVIVKTDKVQTPHAMFIIMRDSLDRSCCILQ